MSKGKETSPEVIELESLCRSFTKANVQKLGGYATGEQTEPGVQIKAIELLLAYGWGRPKQIKEHTGAGGGDIRITIRNLVEEMKNNK